MENVSSTIDWLSVTFHEAANHNPERFAFDNQNYLWEEVEPRNGYARTIASRDGALVMFNTGDNRMGIHVVYPGSCLKAYGERGTRSIDIVTDAVSKQGKVTRLDIAIDVINGNVRGNEIWDNRRHKDRTGSARTFQRRELDDGGYTIEIGSRDSERFMRIYNKAAEQHIDAEWWRLEVECKGDVAKTYARAIFMTPSVNLASFTWAVATKMFNIPVHSYQVFGTKTEKMGVPKVEKQTNTEAWIIEQVIPALKKWVAEHPDSPVYDLVVDALIEAKQSIALTTTEINGKVASNRAQFSGSTVS